MSQNSKENKDRSDENIDLGTLDLAIENAEVRKELSDTELDEIAGGGITACSFMKCQKNL